jgi:hypothetical protein
MSELLGWAEAAGAANMNFRLACTESLAKEASTTLTILLTGLGGALAFAAKGMDGGHLSATLFYGAAGLALWFMLLSVLLVHFCVRTAPIPAPTNEPMNLYQPAYDWVALREAELRNLQERIDQVAARNIRVAAWLDRIRYMAAAAPLGFAIPALAVARWPALGALVAAAG